MPYPQPFHYQIDSRFPLLVVSCSSVKRDDTGDDLVRFIDLYDGPFWRQIKASDFPRSNVAAISGLYGFLEPGMAIRTYDRMLSADSCRRLCRQGNNISVFTKTVRKAKGCFVVGGELYRQLPLVATYAFPDIAPLVSFAEGTFLQQLKQLRLWLEANGMGALV